MKGKNLFNTTPIKIIRIVKGITVEKMADCFGVSHTYITFIENEERSFRTQTLEYGLNNLGISIDEYNEISEFRKFLESKKIEDKEKYKYMLLKTIGVFTPLMKEEIDQTLNIYLSTKVK